jgi:hypothetical protein
MTWTKDHGRFHRQEDEEQEHGYLRGTGVVPKFKRIPYTDEEIASSNRLS